MSPAACNSRVERVLSVGFDAPPDFGRESCGDPLAGPVSTRNRRRISCKDWLQRARFFQMARGHCIVMRSPNAQPLVHGARSEFRDFPACGPVISYHPHLRAPVQFQALPDGRTGSAQWPFCLNRLSLASSPSGSRGSPTSRTLRRARFPVRHPRPIRPNAVGGAPSGTDSRRGRPARRGGRADRSRVLVRIVRGAAL